jgi:homoserine O-acetyltransferase/O-succinyltransferase
MNTAAPNVRTRFFHSRKTPTPRLPLQIPPPLEEFSLAYELYGKMNQAKSNVILLFHAMTGSQHAAGINLQVRETGGRWTKDIHTGWWDPFIGPDKPLDTSRFCILCANYIGSCYGSTGPTSLNPATRKAWGRGFPVLRVADIVDSQLRLLDHFGVNRLHAVIGGSLGGFLCLSLATRYPSRVRVVVPIASGLETTLYQRILNFEQITAIEADQAFRGGNYAHPLKPDTGLALARRIAHKTFVSLETLVERAGKRVVSRKPPHGWYEMNHPIESYLHHQGETFVHRFDANSYLRILDAWQWFDLCKEAGASSRLSLFKRCQDQRFLVFSIDSDLCFPQEEQRKLVRLLKKAQVPVTWITVNSDKGHDSFLLEPELFGPHLRHVLEEEFHPQLGPKRKRTPRP